MQTITRAKLELALKEPKTIQDVANLFGVSERTIRRRMKEHGLEPWGKPFAKGYKIKCLDSHTVASLGEAKIDDFLFETRIRHDVHKKLQGLPCIIDFWLPDFGVGIEYAGVEGIPEYETRIEEKTEIYKIWNIPVIWIFPYTPLESVLEQIIQARKAADQQQDENFQKLMR